MQVEGGAVFKSVLPLNIRVSRVLIVGVAAAYCANFRVHLLWSDRAMDTVASPTAHPIKYVQCNHSSNQIRACVQEREEDTEVNCPKWFGSPSKLSKVSACVHTHTHTDIHTFTHTYTYPHTHTHTHNCRHLAS